MSPSLYYFDDMITINLLHAWHVLSRGRVIGVCVVECMCVLLSVCVCVCGWTKNELFERTRHLL